MSTPLPTIDVSAISGAYTLAIPAAYTVNNTSWIDLLNQSPYNLQFAAGDLQIPIPAWDHYPVQIAEKKGNFWQAGTAVQFPPTITPSLLGSPGSSLATLLTVTLYGPGETPSSTSPRSLNYQNYIPNTVNTAGGDVATSLQNDNKPPLTTIIESTPSDAVASTWHADNSGNLTVKGDNGGTLTTLLELIAGLTPLVRVMGLITMDTTGHIVMSNNITLRWLDSSLNSQAVLVATSSDEVHLRAVKSGGDVIIADSNDTAIATFAAATGLTLASGGVNLTTGSISKISTFGPYGLTTTPAFFNHNLGVIPDFIILTCVGTSSTSETAKYDNTTMTTTQVKLVANGSFNFVGMAIKK